MADQCSQAATVIRLQEPIAAMMSSGFSLDDVEEAVIDPAPLRPDQKAALWLYAWSYTDQSTQRQIATRCLLATAPG